MIPLIGVKLPKGNCIFLTSTIGGATTNPTNPRYTDVYTDTFPDGITINMPLEEFYDVWLGHLMTEIEPVEEQLH